MRTKQDLEKDVEKRFEEIPRDKPMRGTAWARRTDDRPGMDLRNVLAGWHARKSSNNQNTKNLSTRHALPIGNEKFKETGVGILLEENQDYLIQEIADNITSQSTKSTITAATTIITDTKTIQGILEDIKTQHDKKPSEYQPRFNRVLQYLTLKAREEFDKGHPLNIDPNDSTETIKQKVNAHNDLFKQEMTAAKSQLQQTIGEEASLDSIDRATRYCNNALEYAAEYQGDFKYQKNTLYEHTVRTANALKASDPEQQQEHAQSKKDLANDQLDSIVRSAPEDCRPALEWAIKKAKLENTYRETKSPQDAQAITNHQTNYHSDYDKHKQEVQTHMRKAQPALKEYAAYEAVRVRAYANESAFHRAERAVQLEANLDTELDAYVRANINTTFEEDFKEEKAYTDLLILHDIRQSNPNSETIKKKYEDAKKAWNETYPERPYLPDNDGMPRAPHPDGQVELKIQAVIQHSAGTQQLPPAERRVCELAKAKLKYTSGLENLSTLLLQKDEHGAVVHELGNPSPALMQRLQQEAQGLEQTYQSEVKRIHEEAGTYDTLKEASKPLDALRNMDKSLNKILFGQSKQNSARLDVLDTAKYELRGTTSLPRILTILHNTTEEVNKLLEEREEIEHAIEADPGVASRYAGALNKNTNALKSKMMDLQNVTEKAERADYLKTHPDIEAWTKKAAALHDNLNRSLRQKHRWLNAGVEYARTRSGISAFTHLLDNRGHVDHVNGINTIKYDANAAKALDGDTTTVHYESTGGLGYRTIKHTTTIKQADGSEKKEDIKFSRAELQGHFEDFIEQYNLNVGRGPKDVKVSKSGNQITYRWPSEEVKKKWLEYLEKQYKEKRADELKVPQETNATVGVERNSATGEDSSINARTLTV